MKKTIGLFFLLFSLPLFASDPNGYTAQYECRAGGPNCNVDVVALTNQACQQTIAAGAAWSTINWSNNVICLAAGDHTAKGTLTITTSGTSGTRKVLRYYRASDNNDEPWNQSSGNKAKVVGINFNGGDYWILHRISVVHGTSGSGIELISGSNSDNNILSRLDVSGGSSLVLIDGSNDSNTLQNSIVHDGTIASGSDIDCVAVGNNSDIHIVNNEIYGCTHQFYVWGGGYSENLVVENNDIYSPPSMYTNCSGGDASGNPNAPCAKSEVAISLKATTASTNITKIIHNRLWGTRWSDTSVCCDSGTAGQIVSISDQGSFAKWVLFQNNIVFDGPVGIQHPHNVGGVNDHNSYVGNIVWKIYNYRTPGDGQTIELIGGDTEEFYLNTFIDAERWGDVAKTNSDWRCNVYISAGTPAGTTLGSGTTSDYNVYYGTTSRADTNKIDKPIVTRANSTAYSLNQIMRTGAITGCSAGTESACGLYKNIQAGISAASPPTACTTLGCEYTDGGAKWKMVRGPYIFKRKLRTVAGGESYAIPYFRTHASAPEATPPFCPGLGSANSTGSRTNIGVNNDIVPTGIHATSVLGTGR